MHERRDQMRAWLKANGYRNGYVSVDNDDYEVTFILNEARAKNRRIDYAKVGRRLVQHVVGAAEFYDEVAVKVLGRSPKHVLLLHEQDATVMFLGDLVAGLRAKGWEIIPASEAFADPMYQEVPPNLYANNGLIAQLAMEKTGQRLS